VSPPDWVTYLEGLAVFGMRPGLERVAALLDRLGRPQDSYRVVHIVGTNGKSSTTRYTEALLRAHGLRSGAYLSPHILGWHERVLVGGEPIAAELLGRCVERVRALTSGLPTGLGESTQFEVLTVAALLALAESGVEAVALEAGLGGRLDATNVVAAPVVVLTNVALEHTQVLGATRELIFAEKAAVIKGGDAVFGSLDGLEEQARRVCAAAGARAHILGLDFDVGGSPDDFEVTMPAEHGRWACLAVPTPALYQVTNAGLAVAAVRLLLGDLDEGAARRGLLGAGVPGRFQQIGVRPLTIADGAHNPHGMETLVRSLTALRPPRPRVGVLAIMRDKGYDAMLETLVPLLDGFVCTQAHEPRSLPAREVAVAVAAVAAPDRDDVDVVVATDPHGALARARAMAGESGFVVVTGSLYLLEDLSDALVPSVYLRETMEG
jgi:dihydrofolate synthase / folylpolyglutamate synthase